MKKWITLFAAILIFGIEKKGMLYKLATSNTTDLSIFFILFAAIVILIVVLTNWWVSVFYGKYAKQIKAILDELKEEA